MNALIDTYVSAKGLDNAMEIAKILIKNDYQVMIQLDDCDVYIIAFEDNDASLGDNQFASLTQEEVEHIYNLRHDRSLRDLSPDEAQEIVDSWVDEGEDSHRWTPTCSGDTVGRMKL